VERTEPPPGVVCDAGPLIHLDELDSLDLLCDFASVLVPRSVWAPGNVKVSIWLCNGRG
jgi:hypothetical protein